MNKTVCVVFEYAGFGQEVVVWSVLENLEDARFLYDDQKDNPNLKVAKIHFGEYIPDYADCDYLFPENKERKNKFVW